MKIKINYTRYKYDDEIHEVITYQPWVSYINNPGSAIFNVIWILSHHYSIGRRFGYQLKRVDRHLKKKILIYEYNKDIKVPPMSESFEVVYNPNLGKRKCTVCRHLRRYDGKIYCFRKGLELKGLEWPGCRDFHEIWIEDYKKIL